MDFNFDLIASLIHVCIALVFIFFLLSLGSKRQLNNVLISLYLIIFVIDSLSGFVGYYLFPRVPIFSMLLSLTILFYPALLYLIVKSSIYRDFRITSKTALHAIPYLIVNLVLIPIYYQKLINGQFTTVYDHEFSTGIYIKGIYILAHALQLIYLVITIILLLRYRKLLLENFSNPNLGNFKWLLQLVIMISSYGIISIFKNFFRFYNTGSYYNISIYVLNISVTIFLYWLLLKALRNPGLFTGIYSDTKLVRNLISNEGPIGNIINPGFEPLPEETQIKLNEVMNHMITEEPFLDSSLSVAKLARQLKTPTRELSILINHTLNQNFFDFINEYRIEKAKSILNHPDKQDLTILEILYQVGFNSKSSFNTIFKQKTGLTPSQYRKKSLRKIRIH